MRRLGPGRSRIVANVSTKDHYSDPLVLLTLATDQGSETPLSQAPPGCATRGLPRVMECSMEYIKGGLPPSVKNEMRQARYWICTVPRDDWEPCLPSGAAWIIGQPELGESGYRHWQLMVSFPAKKSLAQVKECFGLQGMHAEPTRSAAAETYVRKEETRDGEPFEFGSRVFRRSSSTDWERVKTLAQRGELDLVPPDIYVRYYRTLQCIAADHDQPVSLEKHVVVYYGSTGTGKSRRAFEEAGSLCYVKDPRSKFWCGYRGESSVVFDEFRGGIDVSHMLRWLDRYPVRVELKGSSAPLKAEKIWITSNLHPSEWYPELDGETKKALLRRLEITYFPSNIFSQM